MQPTSRIDATASVEQSHIGCYTDIGPGWTVIESELGDYSYLAGSDGVAIYATIGRFCSIASHVAINPGNHPTDRVSQHHFTYRRRRYGFADTDDNGFFDWRRSHRCRIGHDVWVGHGAKIMAGVYIGTGAVIGAGAVVTREVAPYQVVAGVPARPLRQRFPKYIVDKLMQIAWWNWDRPTLEARQGDFANLDRFLEKYA